MSTFNLSEAVRGGRMRAKVAEAKPEEPAAPDCPQCDGSGREDGLLGFPEVCRRCGGAGMIQGIAKSASIVALAQEDVGIPGDAMIPEDEPEPQSSPSDDAGPYSEYGQGVIGAPDASTSDGRLRSELGDMIDVVGVQGQVQVFDAVCEILAIPPSEKAKHGGTSEQFDRDRAMDFIYQSLDAMNRQQLEALDEKIRQIL